MRLALMGCAAALTFMGAAVAQAEMIYVTEPDAVAAPGYVYSVPGPLPGSRFVVTEPAPVVVTEPSYVTAPPARVINRPMAVTPREATTRLVPQESGVVTTGYSTVRSCFTDLIGVERCY